MGSIDLRDERCGSTVTLVLGGLSPHWERHLRCAPVVSAHSQTIERLPLDDVQTGRRRTLTGERRTDDSSGHPG